MATEQFFASFVTALVIIINCRYFSRCDINSWLLLLDFCFTIECSLIFTDFATWKLVRLKNMQTISCYMQLLYSQSKLSSSFLSEYTYTGCTIYEPYFQIRKYILLHVVVCIITTACILFLT